MRWWRWLPWRRFVSRIAESRGFLDPIALWGRLSQFAQPSEVSEPIELLRAGVIMHARGLINTRAIQHNLDWVWPYWVEKQFNPLDPSFVPRAFSITHINLTHRNWTAVGLPRIDWMPIVDPVGLVTPHYDGWSLDAWIVPDDETPPLLPSRNADVTQQLIMDRTLAVNTTAQRDGLHLSSTVQVQMNDQPDCCITYRGTSDRAGWLVVSLRPVNPEGVSFIHRIERSEDRTKVLINDEADIQLSLAPQRFHVSDYGTGDVLQQIDESDQTSIECKVGMATGAAMYRLEPDQELSLDVTVPYVAKLNTPHPTSKHLQPVTWGDALKSACQCVVPDEKYQTLYDAALRTIVLHSPGSVYPGPYTYRRFWYRDAAFIVEALLQANLTDLAGDMLERFPDGQTSFGYFHSQDGEWDSNGEVLWLFDQYQRMTGRPLPDALLHATARGAKWIERKRLDHEGEELHAGLMPAGFSAEHLGPNDYYYWDNFWSIAGLESASRLLKQAKRTDEAAVAQQVAREMRLAVDRSLTHSQAHRDRSGIPASPYRRMDAGAIGSIVAGYPLRVWEPTHPRLLATVELLLNQCMVRGGFFQDMIHSGINAYLTLHMAQVLLRAGDVRCTKLIDAVADLASPTGQWPEAIHPATRGGCMGDGQHVWAAAEWLMMTRSLFVREENETLILASGIPWAWVEGGGEALRFGPTPTTFGTITVHIEPHDDHVILRWDAQWRQTPAKLQVGLLGDEPQTVDPATFQVRVNRP